MGKFVLVHAINPSNAELNPICHFLALLRDHPILHVSRIRVKVYGKWKYNSIHSSLRCQTAMRGQLNFANDTRAFQISTLRAHL